MALSAQAEWYGVYFFPFFLRKAFSLIVCYFVSGNNPRKAHKLKTEKYLKLLFLPPNKSTKRNRLLFWLNMVSIFFLCPLSFSDKECKKKREEIAINYEEEKKKKGDICFYLEKHAHQIPTAKNSRNICAESIILPPQILKEFILHLPIREWTFQNGCNSTDD